MDVQSEIPPQLYICNYRCRVYYTGMQEKCFICKSTDHLKSDCPRRVGGGEENASGSNLTPRGRAAVSENLKSRVEDSMVIDGEQAGSVVENSIVEQGGSSNQINKDSEWKEVKGKSGKDGGFASSGEHKQINSSESNVSGKSKDRKRVDGSNGSLNTISDVLVSSNPYDGLNESVGENENSDTDPKRQKI